MQENASLDARNQDYPDQISQIRTQSSKLSITKVARTADTKRRLTTLYLLLQHARTGCVSLYETKTHSRSSSCSFRSLAIHLAPSTELEICSRCMNNSHAESRGEGCWTSNASAARHVASRNVSQTGRRCCEPVAYHSLA